MNRIAIFASYSEKGTIEDYVLYYLRNLKVVAEKIIFIADNDISPAEENKLKDLVFYSKCQRHGCYDFGSYRRGFEWAAQQGILEEADEVIFCNDSCYGPVTPLDQAFEKMKQKTCDFWGMIESHEFKAHLQSYFLTFKRQVFLSDAFRDFITSMIQQKDFLQYVKAYEMGLTEYLCKAGFKYAAFIEYAQYAFINHHIPTNPTFYPVTTLELGLPFIKRKVFKLGGGNIRESLMTLIKKLEEKNPELYQLIVDDINKLCTGLNPVPVGFYHDLSVILDHNCHKDKALSVLYEAIRQSSERRIFVADQIITNQQSQYELLVEKNKKHLKQIRYLTGLTIFLLLTLLATILLCALDIIF